MSANIQRIWSVKPRYGHWRPSLKFFLKKPQSDKPWYGHWRLGRKRLFKKKWKNPVCETVVWPLADWVKNLIEKKWRGLSDSGMASGGLNSKFFEKLNPLSTFQMMGVVNPFSPNKNLHNHWLPVFKIERATCHFHFHRKKSYPMMRNIFKIPSSSFSFENKPPSVIWVSVGY